MLLLIIFLLSLVATLSYKYLLKNEAFNPPPGPKKLPFIGNLHHLDLISPHICLAKLAKTYGPVLSLQFGSIPVVVVQSAELAKEVLQTQDLNFCTRPPMFGPRKLSYDGLDIAISPYNDYFREMKKLSVVHLLNTKRVQSFAPIRQQEILRLLNKISSLSTIVNLNELVMSFSCSNICRMAFGNRYDEEEGQKSRFHSLLNEAQASFTAFYFSDYFPLIGWLDKLCGQYSRLERIFKDLDTFYEELINDHLDPNRTKLDQEDFIDVLLHLQKQHCFTFDLSMNHIKALLMNIFIAGTDTSAATIVWGMTQLIKNPHVMKKVQQEIRNETRSKDYVDEEDVQKLEYFKAVVKETFRLHPASPLLVAHESIRKTKIKEYHILPKTQVYVNVWAIGRDPKSWNDPETFKPERFIGSSVDVKGQDFELLPFGAGRRICPGLQLGLSNVELTLANLLNSFDWDLPSGIKRDDVDMENLPGITMHKKNPLYLVAHKFPRTV
ncbi:cytochrome P450 83B1-like [Silene latifolia]|uniref:cytochrome P450 83B1-like n=1 Tax=Silene latifolia TaxID=37657 RepID=UPI003D77C85B